MYGVRIATLAGGLCGATVLVLTGCSTSTSGAGHPSGVVSSASTSTAPTQSSVQTTPTSSPVTTPTTSALASSVSAPATPTTPVRTVSVTGYQTHQTYVIKIWVEKQDASCVGHTYGAQVTAFVAAHPCRGITRLLATTTVNGRPVALAQESTSFQGSAADPYDVSGQFKQLVTANGTGSLNDLLREGFRFPGGPAAVPSPDAFACEGEDAGITIDDIWYLGAATPDNDPALLTFADEVFLQF